MLFGFIIGGGVFFKIIVKTLHFICKSLVESILFVIL